MKKKEVVWEVEYRSLEEEMKGWGQIRGSSELKFVQNSDFFLSTCKAIFANVATKRAYFSPDIQKFKFYLSFYPYFALKICQMRG